MASQQLLDEVLANLDRLPEIPFVALQVNKMLDNPDIDAQDLAKIIMMDPSLTTQVLKICNSAEYGFSRKIATISEAVSILGYKVLKRVIYTIISHGFLNRPVEGYALEKGALWENAVTCATYARFIADKINYKDSELAFVSALLRDIGKIALENYVAGKGETLEIVALENKFSFVEAEEQIVGASHTFIGQELAKLWSLPESLSNVIAYHHQPSLMPANVSQEDKQLVSIVHLADAFTMMTGAGVGIDGLMYPLDTVVFTHLNMALDSGVMDTLFGELLDLQEQIGALYATFEGKGG